MKTRMSSISGSERFKAFSLIRPGLVALAFSLVVVTLRSIGAFVLRLDERPNIMLSGVLGSLLVLGYLRVLRRPIRSIGLHGRNFGKAFLVGALSLLSLYAALYAVQFYRLDLAGESPRLVFATLDHNLQSFGGLIFTSIYLIGQLFNAFMEETIFRGIVLPHLMVRFRFWQANIVQAFLFGLAHLVFPLSRWVSGQATAGAAIAEAAFLLFAATLGGLVFGYLYYRTDSLWTAIFAHLIDNGIGLFFHIQIVNSLHAEADIFILARLGFFALVLLAWIVARCSSLPILEPWLANKEGISI